MSNRKSEIPKSDDEEETLKNQIFVIKLGELLDSGLIEEAQELYERADARGDLAKSLWEIVPVLAVRLTSFNRINNRRAFQTCQKFLEALATRCNPKETLLLLIERIEAAEDDINFQSLLKPLGVSLLRVGPERAVDWCVRSIKNYVRALPAPENEKPPENEEQSKIEDDPIAKRLASDYSAILSFLEPLAESSSLARTSQTTARKHLLHLHLSLFGAPFCYLREEPMKKNDKEKNFCIFESALKQILLVIGDFLKFHAVLDDRSRGRGQRAAPDDEEEENSTARKILRSRRNVSDLAWANYYFYVFNTSVGTNNIPQVYSYRYLMPGIFYVANVLLGQAQYVLVRKGLKIIEVILERVEEQSVGHRVLEIPVYRELFEALSKVMIYCDSDRDRKLALKMFYRSINVFNYRARYLVISELYETANHSGIFSLLTSITKESIIYCLEMGWDFFAGDKLERLIKRICHLPNGASSDLVELSDEIIGALNLVRFLVLRDRNNETGIWRIVDYLDKHYLIPLREGIELARAHWLLKVKDLEDQTKSAGTSNLETHKCDVSIIVGGQSLPKMQNPQKIHFCRQAINALDVIESILVRVNQCIEENSTRKIAATAVS